MPATHKLRYEFVTLQSRSIAHSIVVVSVAGQIILILCLGLTLLPLSCQAQFSTESLATAMHRIASTGTADPSVMNNVMIDRRFSSKIFRQQILQWVSNLVLAVLVREIEDRLRLQPQEFTNQSLANVVWAAGKFRLSVSSDFRDWCS